MHNYFEFFLTKFRNNSGIPGLTVNHPEIPGS